MLGRAGIPDILLHTGISWPYLFLGAVEGARGGNDSGGFCRGSSGGVFGIALLFSRSLRARSSSANLSVISSAKLMNDASAAPAGAGSSAMGDGEWARDAGESALGPNKATA